MKLFAVTVFAAVIVTYLLCEYIRDMYDPFGAALPLQAAIHLRQATRVTRHNRSGFAGVDIPDFIVEQCAAHVGHFHREEAAETAALIRAGKRRYLGVCHRTDERFGLLLDAEHPQAVTGLVKGDLCGAAKRRANIRDP
jgi:hypothetical protein